MAARKKIDAAKLVKMIESGAPLKKIKAAFGFRNAAQLKVAHARALAEIAKTPAARPGRRPATAPPARMTAEVNRRGSLTISKAFIDRMGFVEGDAFRVTQTETGVSIKKI